MKLGNTNTGNIEINSKQGDIKIQEKVRKLCQDVLIPIGSTDLDPDKMWQRMKSEIEKAGFHFYGRGQNRICFGFEGDGYVYKVPFREIGMRDNMMEKINAMIVSSSADVFKAIGQYFPLVTTFSIGETKDEVAFCIEMEFIEDMVSEKFQIGTAEQKSISAYIDNIEVISQAIRETNEFFHMLDLQPLTSALNIGNKEGNPCFRDIGYFVPRVGDLTEIDHTVGGVSVEYLYVPYDMYMSDLKDLKTMKEKETYFGDIAEAFYPVDKVTRKQVGGEDAFVDGTSVITPALEVYSKMIQNGDFDEYLLPYGRSRRMW